MKNLGFHEIREMIAQSASGPFSCYYSGPETNFIEVRMQVVFWPLADGGLRYYATECGSADGRRRASEELKQYFKRKPN
jgi:hypothetical protein